jgi:hypothetical protein
MGQLRFIASRSEHLAARTVELAYVAGIEGVPWPCQCHTEGQPPGELVVERASAESGNLHLLWYAKGIGETVISTASLMERQRPYNLPVELARGTVNRLRNQIADWQLSGYQIPPADAAAIREIAALFSRVATSQDVAAAERDAEQAICDSLRVGQRLAAECSRQHLAARRQETGPLSVLFGGVVPPQALQPPQAAFVSGAWNSVAVPFPWRSVETSPGRFAWDACDAHIEWCLGCGLRVVGGPLVCLTRNTVPDWLHLWEDDFDHVQKLLLHFLHAVVQRYRGKVHIWNCLGGINVPGSLTISEEQRLRLAVTAMEELRRVDSATPAIVAFDQPWGEYLSAGGLELSPLHFADALVRADLGIAGLGLELNLGYWPGGTLPRDAVELSHQLDRWSLLGMPLVVFLTIPSSAATATHARLTVRPPSSPAPPPSLASQEVQAAQFVRLILSKPFVQGLFWNQFSDAGTDCAHGGLFDPAGNPKPVCAVFQDIFQQHFV